MLTNIAAGAVAAAWIRSVGATFPVTGTGKQHSDRATAERTRRYVVSTRCPHWMQFSPTRVRRASEKG